jgi:hypothetical protein
MDLPARRDGEQFDDPLKRGCEGRYMTIDDNANAPGLKGKG